MYALAAANMRFIPEHGEHLLTYLHILHGAAIRITSLSHMVRC